MAILFIVIGLVVLAILGSLAFGFIVFLVDQVRKARTRKRARLGR